MKSYLFVLFILILLPFSWWCYNSYIDCINCENCQKNPNKYYLHFVGWEHWNKTRNYYLLDCFCDKKIILKSINALRKNIAIIENKDVTFLKDDFHQSDGRGRKGRYYGSEDEISWEDVRASSIAAQFTRDTTNFNRLSYVWFEYKLDTLLDKKIEKEQLNKSLSRVVYNVDYEELNRSVLNEFAQTVFKDSTRFKYPTCVYHLYNRQNKTVEATMKYEDNGKGFYFEIW